MKLVTLIAFAFLSLSASAVTVTCKEKLQEGNYMSYVMEFEGTYPFNLSSAVISVDNTDFQVENIRMEREEWGNYKTIVSLPLGVDTFEITLSAARFSSSSLGFFSTESIISYYQAERPIRCIAK